MLGQPERVHFSHLGSAMLVSSIEEPAWPKVTERVRGVHHGNAPKDAIKAYRALDAMLAKDNAVGVLSSDAGADFILLPAVRARSRCAMAHSASAGRSTAS